MKLLKTSFRVMHSNTIHVQRMRTADELVHVLISEEEVVPLRILGRQTCVLWTVEALALGVFPVAANMCTCA